LIDSLAAEFFHDGFIGGRVARIAIGMGQADELAGLID
jgi:hypothetical protein